MTESGKKKKEQSNAVISKVKGWRDRGGGGEREDLMETDGREAKKEGDCVSTYILTHALRINSAMHLVI